MLLAPKSFQWPKMHFRLCTKILCLSWFVFEFNYHYQIKRENIFYCLHLNVFKITMEFVRIYIPEELLRETADRQFFGSYQVNGKTASFYIASTKESSCKDIQCIGQTGSEFRHIRETFFLDFLPADQINKTIKLRLLLVHGQPVNSKTKIQIIIFDRPHFLSISTIDVSPVRRAFDEEFLFLLETLQKAHNRSSIKPKICSRNEDESKNESKTTYPGNRFQGMKSSLSAIRNTAVSQHLFARKMQFGRLNRFELIFIVNILLFSNQINLQQKCLHSSSWCVYWNCSYLGAFLRRSALHSTHHLHRNDCDPSPEFVGRSKGFPNWSETQHWVKQLFSRHLYLSH